MSSSSLQLIHHEHYFNTTYKRGTYKLIPNDTKNTTKLRSIAASSFGEFVPITGIFFWRTHSQQHDHHHHQLGELGRVNFVTLCADFRDFKDIFFPPPATDHWPIKMVLLGVK